jgi:hypothetical protein
MDSLESVSLPAIPLLLPVALAAIGLVVILLLLALTGDGPSLGPLSKADRRLGRLPLLQPAELARLLSNLFEARGFSVLHERHLHDRCEVFLEDPTPITGQRLSVRCVLPNQHTGEVDADTVFESLDQLHAEALSRAVLVTTGRFSTDAREAAKDGIELIDGEQLARMLRDEAPEVAARLHLSPPERAGLAGWGLRRHARG